jgi:hypothetical protein
MTVGGVRVRAAGQIRARMSLVAAIGAIVFGASVVLATDINPAQVPMAWDGAFYQGSCDEVGIDPPPVGDVVWHFVQPLPEQDSGLLTATFEVAGTLTGVENTPAGGTALHWYVTTGHDTLLHAYDDVDAGTALRLVHTCTGSDDPVPSPTFATAPPPPPPGETPAGSNVAVAPAYDGGDSPVQLTFETVDGAGFTTLATSDTAPALPFGYQLGDPAVFYDLTTTATYAGSITVCIDYGDASPAPTALLHYENGAWADVTTSLDPDARVICGTTTSLSPFAVVAISPLSISAFGQPLDDPATGPGGMSVFKRGSTIPLRFSIRDSSGALLSDADASAIAARCGARVTLAQTGVGAPPVDETIVSTTPNAGSCFRYEIGAHQFVFFLGTKDLAAPATYTIGVSVTSSAGTILGTHTLEVGLR